jgi:hypothetical protein
MAPEPYPEQHRFLEHSRMVPALFSCLATRGKQIKHPHGQYELFFYSLVYPSGSVRQRPVRARPCWAMGGIKNLEAKKKANHVVSSGAWGGRQAYTGPRWFKQANQAPSSLYSKILRSSIGGQSTPLCICSRARLVLYGAMKVVYVENMLRIRCMLAFVVCQVPVEEPRALPSLTSATKRSSAPIATVSTLKWVTDS